MLFGAIPVWRTSLGVGQNIRLDYRDTEVGTAGLIFNMATQTVLVLPYNDGKPVILYTQDGKQKKIEGHKAIIAEGIHGRTKRGGEFKIV